MLSPPKICPECYAKCFFVPATEDDLASHIYEFHGKKYIISGYACGSHIRRRLNGSWKLVVPFTALEHHIAYFKRRLSEEQSYCLRAERKISELRALLASLSKL